jgi:hypothetical protein
MDKIDKQFFLPGDIVEVRQDIPYKPTMLVVKKVMKINRLRNSETTNFFQGILCR